ncbi:MAG: peptide deformylase [Galactobacter sp.]
MSHPLGLIPSLPIVQLGDPVLRQPAAVWDGVSPTPTELHALVELMVDTMHTAPGVGVAAPQVGVSLRLAVLEDRWPVSDEIAVAREREPLDLIVALDPSYQAIGDRTAAHYEGCLSMNGYTAVVERPADIVARYTTLDGDHVETELHGWQARIFQHETDHLDGTLYIDKAIPRSLSTPENYARFWAEPTTDAARTGLGF